MFLSSLVQKAQAFIDPSLATLDPGSNQGLSQITLDRDQSRLPDSRNPLYEVTGGFALCPPHT
ncbi:hypothetical protein LTS18_004129, partial [Coniosporium uncinatum]